MKTLQQNFKDDQCTNKTRALQEASQATIIRVNALLIFHSIKVQLMLHTFHRSIHK